MPMMEYNIGRVSWCQSLAWLLGVAGCYHSIIDWAGLAPAVSQTAEWVGPHESAVYTLPRLATYLAANRVTYHDADDAWVWGHTHLQELHGWYLGDNNLEVANICDEIKADACRSSGEAVSHSCECITELAETWGIEPQTIPPLASSGECETNGDWQNQLANAAELYSLPSAPLAAPSPLMDVDHPLDLSGACPLEDGEVEDLFEGPTPM